jgi:hypothetical protein
MATRTQLRHAPSAGLAGLRVAPSSRRTSGEIEQLVAQIRLAEAVQKERIQAIVDGAVLAVEQVQDVRIDVLEKGPEVTATDMVFDLLLSFAMGRVAAVLEPITKSIVGNLVKAVGYSRAGPALIRIASAVDSGFDDKGAEVFVQFAVGKDRSGAVSQAISPQYVKQYNALARKTVSRAAKGLVTAEKLESGFESVASGVEKLTGGSGALAADDSAGTAILGAAQTYASTQRAFISKLHALFEAAVRGGADEQERGLIREAVSWPDLPEEINRIRDRYKIMFEAAIWAKIFGFDQQFSKARAGSLKHGTTVQLEGVEDRLLVYWQSRFASAVDDWMRGLEQRYTPAQLRTGPGIDAYDPDTHSVATFDQGRQASYVNQFMKAVAEELMSLPSDGLTVNALAVARKG